jgi:hypothetical protein
VIVAAIVIVALLATGGVLGFSYLAFLRTALRNSIAHTSPSASASASGAMQKPITADSRLAAAGGTVVFTDDFHDPGSGWSTGTAASGTTYQYSNAGFVIAGKGSLHHLAWAPYTRPFTQLSMEISATQTAAAPDGAGFGVTCDTGDGSTELHYTLIVEQPGTWYLERSDGPASLSLIKQGSSSAAPDATPMSITGMCATLADGHTTRLALFVNGTLVADASDYSSNTVTGWVGGIVASSREGQVTTVTFTKFEERDLSG